MKVVILAGGLGTRIMEESNTRPKPMIEVGGKPILWHIMKMYSYYGINDFIICCGHKGYIIKEYFANYFLHMSDVTFDMNNNKMEIHKRRAEPWKVTLIDTGELSMTGGRILRVSGLLKNDDAFCLTYGDGLSDINIASSIDFHFKHGKAATLTATYPPARFGVFEAKDGKIKKFIEKPRGDGSKINGGFFVLSPKIFQYLEDDDTVWENQPLQSLAKDGELMSFDHEGFWQPMDTMKDKNYLNDLWDTDKAPWKVW